MNKHATEPSIETAAREFIERYGKTAPEIARERVEALSINGSSVEHDRALLLLSAVEELSTRITHKDADR